MQSSQQKMEDDKNKSQKDRLQVAGAIDKRMEEEEEELTMLKDCAALIKDAKLESDKEKKEGEIIPEDLLKTLTTKKPQKKSTGAIKVLIPVDDPNAKKLERSKGAVAADRLNEDKLYLDALSNMFTQGVGLDACDGGVADVHKEVKCVADEALQFLKDREEFWDQLALGKDNGNKKKGKKAKPTKALESTRLLF